MHACTMRLQDIAAGACVCIYIARIIGSIYIYICVHCAYTCMYDVSVSGYAGRQVCTVYVG